MAKVKTATRMDIPGVEWICASLGLLIVLAFLGYSTFQAWNQDTSPPDPVTEIVSTEKTQQGYRVRVRVANKGGRAAAGLRIEGRLYLLGEEVQKSEFVLDYLAAKSQAEGGLFFPVDPGLHELQVRASGYNEP